MAFKFKVGDKVRVNDNICRAYQHEKLRYIGLILEVWTVKENGTYILSSGCDRFWTEDQLDEVTNDIIKEMIDRELQKIEESKHKIAQIIEELL